VSVYPEGQIAADVIEVRDPQDGHLLEVVPKASKCDVERALDIAYNAKHRARQSPTHERIRILSGAADLLANRQETFATTIASEGIKTIREARKEASRCVDTLKIAAEEARRLTGETLNFDQRAGSENRFGYITREPVGIITAITPFNDPLNLVAHKLAPALAAGNVIILKPHSATPLSAIKLVGLLHEAGLPAGVVQVVVGPSSEIGLPLISDPRVRMVSFTGGRRAGEAILRYTGLKKVSMELGSNCPTIVMDDADVNKAVADCVSGAYWAAGQNCLHVQRLYVQAGVYETFKEQFVERANAYKVGNKLEDTTDMGCLINSQETHRVANTVNEALANGARLLCGGKRESNFYSPTLLEHVSPQSTALTQEEIYGPVTVLEKFSTLEQAVRLANAVDYGLQAAIFTTNLHTAHYAIQHLEAGAVIVNDSTDYRIDAMPFGGVKGSGLGREGVRHAVLEMSEPKIACLVL
jgi:glyceraldehyde-3-phosphate dehydrogenase (NADP+)